MLILVSIPLIAVSVIFTVMGINTLNRRSYLTKVCTEQAVGIVYDFKVSGAVIDDEDGYQDYRTYMPLFEYEVNGVVYTLESDFGTKEKRFKIGQEITVYYNPENPEEGRVPEDKGGGSGPYLLIGLACLLIGLDITAIIKVFVLKVFG